MAQIFDENGLTFFIDDNGVTEWEDDNGDVLGAPFSETPGYFSFLRFTKILVWGCILSTLLLS